MATTQEYYRIGGRLPRYTTKLSSFANGMYLTNQMIPEGYAKAMINYDIDDTGSNIRPKRGRQLIQEITYDTNMLGAISLTDYVYSYNKNNTDVNKTEDIVLSYGMFTDLENFASNDQLSETTRNVFLSYMDKTTDTTLYNYNEETGQYEVSIEGEITDEVITPLWCIRYNTDTESFEKVINKDIGFISARVIDNAYAFEKVFKQTVGRPIGVVLDNELYAFTGSKLKLNLYTNNPERNQLQNYGLPVLSKLIVSDEEDGTYSIKRKVIDARKLNPLEAYASGFNILLSNPYQFENEESGTVTCTGAVPYTDVDNFIPAFFNKVGQTINYIVYYSYGANTQSIKCKVEINDPSSSNNSWEVLNDFNIEVKPGPTNYIKVPITIKYANTNVRFTLRANDDEKTDYSLATSLLTTNTNAPIDGTKLYDLATCKGMISWSGCLGVYGVTGAENMIYFSEVGDPSYFPFPDNVIIFDNEILAVHNYLDHLIVVTVDSIWLVSAGDTISTSIQKRILTNIHIPEIDAINLVVLKDQIFFKTDTQFYVLKPNQYTSDSTDLKNYVNSTAIANYTKNFTEATVNLLNKVYVELWQSLTKEHRKQIRFTDFDVLDTHSIVRDNEVHYIYKTTPILTDDIRLGNLDVHLVYNTTTRSWRMYFVAIGSDSVYYNPILYRNKQSGAFYEFIPHTKSDNTSSIAITKQTYDVVDDNVIIEDWTLTNSYNNYNLLDTGNVALDDMFTKRYREVQINLLNLEHTKINFYADFIVDSRERRHATKYVLEHITEDTDPDYGKIFVTPIEDSNLELIGLTTLGDTVLDTDYWELDLSKFPNLNIVTVRFNVEGRGRRCSLQLVNTSLKRYELSDMVWVYRIMNAR